MTSETPSRRRLPFRRASRTKKAGPAQRVPYSPQPKLTAAMPTMGEADRYRYWGSALIAIGMVLIVFVLQALIILPVQYSRDQQVAFTDFRYDLANGTAPVGQISSDDVALAAGTPVALLTAPTIDLTDAVVLAGTSSDVTSKGPGLRRDTVLPGQSGASVIIGRASAYGGPFSRLASLRVGDTITAVTGQGTSTYQVTDVRRGGDPLPEAMTTGQGRLTLVSTYAPIPYIGTDVIRVDATLTSAAFVTPDSVVAKATLSADEDTLAGDPSVLPWLVLTLIGICLVAVLITLGVRYWGRWQAWIVGFPVLLLLSTVAAGQAMTLLPNTL